MKLTAHYQMVSSVSIAELKEKIEKEQKELELQQEFLVIAKAISLVKVEDSILGNPEDCGFGKLSYASWDSPKLKGNVKEAIQEVVKEFKDKLGIELLNKSRANTFITFNYLGSWRNLKSVALTVASYRASPQFYVELHGKV